MTTITWLPQQDNYVEGSINKAKFYIHLKKVEDKLIVDSLYIIEADKEKRKIMAVDHKVSTIEEMKIVATNLYSNTILSK